MYMHASLDYFFCYCVACDSSCTGLNQCYGSLASECCNYNDNGNCTVECGVNKEVNSEFDCVCINFWIGDSCDSTYVHISHI